MLRFTILLLHYLAARVKAYRCIEFSVPMSFEADVRQPNFAPFENQLEAVQFLSDITASNAASLPPPYGATRGVKLNVTVAVQYCSSDDTAAHPHSTRHRSREHIVQIVSPEIGFDHSYWFFGGPSSQYNYVKAATQEGYSTLSYDRIETGGSTICDSYTVQQSGPQVEILRILTSELLNGSLSKHAKHQIPTPSKIFQVGHSYGSTLAAILAGKHPSMADALILTGFGSNGTWELDWKISQGMHIASEHDPLRFGAYKSNGYMTWPDAQANQFLFFHYPNFDPEVLAETERTKWPYGIGEFVAQLPADTEAATDYNGPVLLMSGAYDRIFCESDCHGVLHETKHYWPNAQPFEAYIQPDTGHCINLHFNATGAYPKIHDFLSDHLEA